MKRLAAVGAGLALTIALAGCSSTPAEDNGAKGQPAQEQKAPEAKVATKDFDGSKCSDTGAGTMAIYAASGDTSDGSTLVFTLPKDTLLFQIGCETSDLPSEPVTYIYIDGIEATKGNFSRSQHSLNVTEGQLEAGIEHVVEAVQFASDDPSGEVMLYKSAKYEIKN